MATILIKNGHLIDPANNKSGAFDLLISKSVLKIGPRGKVEAGDQAIDAKGCVVAPGFIDLHVHLRDPGFEYKESLRTGTAAAAAGGFTAVCCMANTEPVNDCASVTEAILRKAKTEGLVHVYPIGAISKGLKGEELAPMAELKGAGCVAVSDDGATVQNARLMRMAFEYAKSFDLPVSTHSIDAQLAGDGVMNEGFVATELGLAGIPVAAEDVIIVRDLILAELTGAHLHIGHISTASGVDMVRRAKKRGVKVTCEATPHHFTLTDEAVRGYDTNAKMCPPLRTEEDRKAIVKGLADGTIDAIATDHAPHAVVDKEIEFDRAAWGVIGLETALSLAMRLVHAKKLSLEKMVELLTSSPARLMQLPGGHLSVGAPADVVVFDPHAAYKIDVAQFRSKSRNSPFHGWTVQGRAVATIVGGKIVFGGRS